MTRPSETMPSPRRSPRNRLRRWMRNAIIISVLAHIVFGIGAAFIVALRSTHQPQAIFQADPQPRPRLEPRKVEMSVKVKDLTRRSSRPRLQPRLTVQAPSDLALPDIPRAEKSNRRVQRTFATVGMSGFGDGIGGGLGTGSGGGVGMNFFGLQSSGEVIVFVIDISGSMIMPPKQIDSFDRIEREVARALDGIIGVSRFNIIAFAGSTSRFQSSPVPADETQVEQAKQWLARNNPRTAVEKGETPQRVPWDRRKSGRHFGTRTDKALRTAFRQEPDVIILLSDGEPTDVSATEIYSMVDDLQAGMTKRVQINTFSYQTTSGRAFMKELAERNGGRYTSVD